MVQDCAIFILFFMGESQMRMWPWPCEPGTALGCRVAGTLAPLSVRLNTDACAARPCMRSASMCKHAGVYVCGRRGARESA